MMRAVLGNIGWLLGSRGINALLSLVYLALATRMLGLNAFGQLALIVVLGQAVVGVASFNTWQAVIRWGGSSAAPVSGFAVALDLASVVFGLALAGFVCTTAPSWLPLAPDMRLAAFAFCCAALIAIRSTPTGLLRLHDRYDLATMAEAALPLTRALCAGLAAVFAPTVLGFVSAWALAELACASAYWLLASRYVRLRRRDISLIRFPRTDREVWRFVWATSLSRTAAVSTKQVLMLAVGGLGGAALAGGYRVASQLGQALAQGGEAVSRAIYPELVRQPKHRSRLAKSMAMLAGATGLGAALVAVAGGKFVIALIAGPEFVFAYKALIVLAVAGALDLAVASWDAMLVADGRAGTAVFIRAVPLLIALATMPWAIGAWGLVGAASCVLGASACTACGLALICTKPAPGAGRLSRREA